MRKEIKVKILAIDLDGTLLTPYKRITKNDLIALKKFANAGGHIFISTGKALDATLVYVNKISKFIKQPLLYCASLNGNIIYDIRNKKILNYNVIPNEDCLKLYDICKKNKVLFAPYSSTCLNNVNKSVLKKWPLPSFFNNIGLIFKFKMIKKYRKMDAFKINLISRTNKLINMEKFNHDIDKINSIQVLKTSDYLYEVVKKGSNKGSALEFICKKLKIDLKDAGAIGDSRNDIPMFNVAGHSYLVKDRKDKDFLKVVKTTINKKKNKVAEIINNYVLIN